MRILQKEVDITEEKVYEVAEIFSLNQTNEIMKSKARDVGKGFYHYTTTEKLEKILAKDERGNRFLFASNFKEMNDKKEETWHKTTGDRIHSFCTCCTRHEKIPLWYIYSGICGNGVRIGFTPGKMLPPRKLPFSSIAVMVVAVPISTISSGGLY